MKKKQPRAFPHGVLHFSLTLARAPKKSPLSFSGKSCPQIFAQRPRSWSLSLSLSLSLSFSLEQTYETSYKEYRDAYLLSTEAGLYGIRFCLPLTFYPFFLRGIFHLGFFSPTQVFWLSILNDCICGHRNSQQIICLDCFKLSCFNLYVHFSET